MGPVALRARLAPDVLQRACELLGIEKNPVVHLFLVLGSRGILRDSPVEQVLFG